MKSLAFPSTVFVQFFSECNRKKVLTAAKTVGAEVVSEFFDFGTVEQDGVFGGPTFGKKTCFLKLQFINGKGPAELRDDLVGEGLVYNQNGMSNFKLLSALFSPEVSEIELDRVPLDSEPGKNGSFEVARKNREIMEQKMFHINENILCPHCCTRNEKKKNHNTLPPDQVIFFCPNCNKN